MVLVTAFAITCYHVPPILPPASPARPLSLHVPLSPFSRLRAMRREAKVAELKVLDDARQRFLKHQKTAKEVELQRLDDEIKRRVSWSWEDEVVNWVIYSVGCPVVHLAGMYIRMYICSGWVETHFRDCLTRFRGVLTSV